MEVHVYVVHFQKVVSMELVLAELYQLLVCE